MRLLASFITLQCFFFCIGEVFSSHPSINYSFVKNQNHSISTFFLPTSYQLNGTIRYFNTLQTPIDSTWIYLCQGGNKIDSVFTTSNGQYSFSNVINGTYTIQFSSLKNWKGVDSVDVRLIEKHSAYFVRFTEPVVLLAADVNDDNAINATDALKVRLRISGKILSFEKKNWVFAKPITGGDTVIVNGENLIQDFFGICSGDVNGSRLFPLLPDPCAGISTVLYEGQNYQTVKIGGQCWFKENLNVGTIITGAQNQDFTNGIIDKYCYDDLESNCSVYGGLYQWNEMMTCLISPNPSGKQGICPTGWHVATQEEWCTLSTYLEPSYNFCWEWGWRGISVGGKLKESGTLHWNSPNTGATNSSQFTALPGGIRYWTLPSDGIGNAALFWTSTSASEYSAFQRILQYDNQQIYNSDNYKNRGLSVRCIRDTCPAITMPNSGPDQLLLMETTAQLAGNAVAVNETGTWYIIVGSCGIFGNIHDPLTTFSGKTGTSYVLRWEITNFCFDTIYDDVTISFTLPSNSCPGFDSIIYGGQKYHTVQIGTQCWLRENLNIGTMIPSVQFSANNSILEKYCFENDSVNCCIYGALYLWDEAMQYAPSSNNVPSGVQGICPSGWHIPSDNEWDTLVYYLGWVNTAGGKLKETSYTYWWSPNTGATNETGFTAFGSGDRGWNGGSGALKDRVSYWSSFNQWMRRMNAGDAILVRSPPYSSAGYSVRCIKDPCASVIPATTSDAGSDQLNLNCNQTLLEANVPASDELGAWNIITGTGGIIDSLNNPHSTFTGFAGQTYVLRWSISNICGGISSDFVTLSFTGFEGTPCVGFETVSYAGKTYNTVQVGSQCWLKENLNIGTMIDSAQNQANNSAIEKYCYRNDPADCATYGGLYQWDEMMQYSGTPGTKGICPDGWHLPTESDWTQMITYLGGSSIGGGKLKSTCLDYWNTPNTGAANTYGYYALGTGIRNTTGHFSDNLAATYFWSSETSGSQARYKKLAYNTSSFTTDWVSKQSGFPARCVHDCAAPTSANAGPDQLNIQGSIVTLVANDPGSGETGTWSIHSDNHGTFEDIHNPDSPFSGKPEQSYTLQWTITNSCGNSSYDTVTISYALPTNSCPGTPFVIYQGKTYHTVQIGSQCWLSENMNVGLIKQLNEDLTDNGIIEKYCFADEPSNCEIYGAFYLWGEAMQYTPSSNSVPSGVQGVCPSGWHIPSDNEWDSLVYYLGWVNTAGGKLKESTSIHWSSPNIGATNETGFTAFGSGDRGWNGGSGALKDRVSYWSSFNQWMRRMNAGDAILVRSPPYSSAGYSVRCIKDPCSSVIPATTSDAGSDQLNLNCNQTVLTANVPASDELGAWNIITGIGGIIDSLNNPHSTFTGFAGQTYVLRWTISNICGGISSDFVTLSFTGFEGTPCVGFETLSYGGKTYNTVQVGSQCWLKENLDIGTMIDSIQNQLNNTVIEKYCYRNNPSNCSTLGALYQWDEMMQYSSSPGTKGICPVGWHLPTETEWTDMIAYLNGSANAGGKLKSTCQEFWNNPNTGASNLYGFYALGTGLRNSSGNFSDNLSSSYFWSSETSGSQARYKKLTYDSPAITTDWISKQSGFPARCVHDCAAPTSANAGPDQLNVSGSIVIHAANTVGSGETGTWTIRSNNYGTFEDIHNPNSSFSGKPEQTYNLQWTITNSCGNSSYDTVTISYSLPPNFCPGTPSVSYEGKTYHTVQIGSQCWLMENMNVGLIKQLNEDMTDNGIIEKYCYDDEPSNCEIYGAFYLWGEAMQYAPSSNTVPSGVRGICPSGWHIPSDNEWDTLQNWLGSASIAGGKLKETSLAHWSSPNTGATNETGFTAFGAGDRGWNGGSGALKDRVSYWSSFDQWMRRMNAGDAILLRSPPYSSAGYNVRCLKD